MTAKAGIRRLTLAWGATATALLLAAMTLQPTYAASPGGAAAKATQHEAAPTLKQVEARAAKLRDHLQKAERTAMQKHPELHKKRQDFQKLVVETMKKQGYDPEPHVKHLKALRDQIQGGTVKSGKRKELIQEFQKEAAGLRAAQEKAFKVKKVRDASTALRREVLSALKEADPHFVDYLKEYRHLQQEALQLRRGQGGKS